MTEAQAAAKAHDSGEERYLGGLPGCSDLGGQPRGGKQQQPERTGQGTDGRWRTCETPEPRPHAPRGQTPRQPHSSAELRALSEGTRTWRAGG